MDNLAADTRFATLLKVEEKVEEEKEEKKEEEEKARCVSK